MLLRQFESARSSRLLATASSALFVGLLLLYMAAAPAFRGPDEPHHFDLVREWSLEWNYPVLDRQISNQVYESLTWVEFSDRSQHLEQADAPSRSERLRFTEVGPDVDSIQYNQISQHPPLYYVMLGTAVWGADMVEPGSRWAFDRELAIARLFTIAMLAPVPALIFAMSRRLRLSRSTALAAALLPATIPQLTHIGSTVNNDNLVLLLSALLAWLCVRAFDDDRRRVALVLGIVAALMLLTKAFGIIAPPMIALAYAVAWRRRNTRLRSASSNLAIAAAVTLALSGWWYGRNFVVYGTPQPSRSLLAPAADGFEADLGYWWTHFATFVPNRFFGDFGWFDVNIGRAWVAVGMIVLASGAAIAVLAPRESNRLTRPVAIGFLLPFAILLGYLMFGTWSGYVQTSQLPRMQGRYLFPALPFLAPVIAAGWDRLLGPLRTALPLFVIVYGLCFHVVGMAAMLGFYWAPPGASTRDQIAAMVSWSPWPSAVFVLGVGFLAAALVAVAAGSLSLVLPVGSSPPSPVKSAGAARRTNSAIVGEQSS